MAKIIILLIGQPGSGKSEASRHLSKTYDFTSVLISDLIREYASTKHIILHERKDYVEAHTQLLKEHGQYVITKKILDSPSGLICVDGIRVPAHVIRLKEYGAVPIALECPPELRFSRTLTRNSGLDKTDYTDFLSDETLESRNTDPFVQNTVSAMKLADYHLDSSKSLLTVLEDMDSIIDLLLSRASA